MSSFATPINAERFEKAIRELPLASLHLKAAEIRNSIAHLLSSNQQLQPFADEGDSDCIDAILENVEVIQKMEKRISLLKAEVEGRGFSWVDDKPTSEDVQRIAQIGTEELGELSRMSHEDPNAQRAGGRLGDQGLARKSREQVHENGGEMVQDGLQL